MENSQTNRIHYQSYLLRVWRDDQGFVRLITLQSTTTEKILQFATLELLFDFLSTPPDVPTGGELGDG